MTGTRVTAFDVNDPASAQSIVIRDNYILITDGRVYLHHTTRHENGTTILTIHTRQDTPPR